MLWVMGVWTQEVNSQFTWILTAHAEPVNLERTSSAVCRVRQGIRWNLFARIDWQARWQHSELQTPHRPEVAKQEPALRVRHSPRSMISLAREHGTEPA